MKTTGRILLSAALFAWSALSLAQEQFNTPEEAVDALVGAAKTGDAKAILAVLGPDGQADRRVRAIRWPTATPARNSSQPMMPSMRSSSRAAARRR